MKLARLPDGSPELFHTLQGEGPSLGAPAVFLRLSLCNLHCHWCDTPYTWNFEGTPWPHQDDKKFSKTEQILERSPEEIAPLIGNYQCPRLVLTGGEPLLQQNDLASLIPLVPGLEFVEIETNGTQLPSPEFDSLVTAYNVSPKLTNSGMPESLRLKEGSLRFFANSPKAIFKFVVQNEKDLREIQSLEKRFRIPKNRIFLMPEGRSPNLLAERSNFIANICIKTGYNMTPRLHVLLWGDERAK